MRSRIMEQLAERLDKWAECGVFTSSKSDMIMLSSDKQTWIGIEDNLFVVRNEEYDKLFSAPINGGQMQLAEFLNERESFRDGFVKYVDTLCFYDDWREDE